MSNLKSHLSTTILALAVVGAGFTSVPALTVNPAYADAVRIEAPEIPGFGPVVEAVSPAVVSVRVKSNIRPVSNRGEFRFGPGGDFEDQMRRFFERRGERARPNRRDNRGNERLDRARPISHGSGFFISEDGFLVTNNHVIENGTEFTVVMNDGQEYDARLIGTDSRTDLAVLKVDDGDDFTYVDFADENDVNIGDWVVAVGNPFGLGGTVTAGILSARGRNIGAGPYDDFLQIDAAVNRGNSGGPTFNLNGEVVGINTAIYSPSGGNVGIAFAVPATLAQEVITDLMDDGSVERGWLGVSIQPVTDEIAESLGLEDASGALVSQPQEGAPAETAGIRAGDIIAKVDGKEIDGPRDLSKTIAGIDPGTDVEITLLRNGSERAVTLQLGELPNDEVAALQPSPEDPAEIDDLGITLIPNDRGEGMLVTAVKPGSEAAQSGLRPGDVVLEVNNNTVASAADIQEQLGEVKKDGRKAALFRLENGDRSRFLAVPIG